MNKSSITSTNHSGSLTQKQSQNPTQRQNYQDNNLLNRKMRRIELMLNSLREDEEDELMHLQSLMAKGAEVQNQVQTRINQCQQLKDFIKIPNHMIRSTSQDKNKHVLPVKGMSLESKRNYACDQEPLKRMRTSISPDGNYKIHKIGQKAVDKKKEVKIKKCLIPKPENRLEKLASLVHSSIEDLKIKEKQKQKQRQKVKQGTIQERNSQEQRNDKFFTEQQRPVSPPKPRINQSNKRDQIKTEQSKSITSKLIIIFALGLIFGLFTYL